MKTVTIMMKEKKTLNLKKAGLSDAFKRLFLPYGEQATAEVTNDEMLKVKRLAAQKLLSYTVIAETTGIEKFSAGKTRKGGRNGE